MWVLFLDLSEEAAQKLAQEKKMAAHANEKLLASRCTLAVGSSLWGHVMGGLNYGWDSLVLV